MNDLDGTWPLVAGFAFRRLNGGNKIFSHFCQCLYNVKSVWRGQCGFGMNRAIFCILRMSQLYVFWNISPQGCRVQTVLWICTRPFHSLWGLHFLAWSYFSPRGQKMYYISRQINYIDPQMNRASVKRWIYGGWRLYSSPVICNVMNGHKGGEKCINIIRYSLLMLREFRQAASLKAFKDRDSLWYHRRESMQWFLLLHIWD